MNKHIKYAVYFWIIFFAILIVSSLIYHKLNPVSADGYSAYGPWKGAVEAVDAAAESVTIAGTQYTTAFAESVSLDGIAVGDSVNYTLEGTTITSLYRFYTAAPAPYASDDEGVVWKSAVEAVDAAAKAITIAGTQYTTADGISLDGIAFGDSVNYTLDGTTITSLYRFYAAAPRF